MLQVLVADDDEFIRLGLRTMLGLTAGVEVVGEVDRTDCLAARVQQSQPDLVLLDWELRGHVDASLLDTVRSAASHPRIVVLSTQADQERAALAAGAETFFCKADPPGYLLALVSELATAKEKATAGSHSGTTCRDA